MPGETCRVPLTRRFAPHRLVRWLQAEPQLGVQAWAGKQASPCPHLPAPTARPTACVLPSRCSGQAGLPAGLGLLRRLACLI